MDFEINAKAFVAWLLKQPVIKRMKAMRHDEAMAVARKLARLAQIQPETNLQGLALAISRLALYLPGGKLATNEQCQSFFTDFSAYLPGHDLKKAIRALESMAQTKGRSPGFAFEFRPERPAMYAPLVVYTSRTRKRMMEDDISERLSMAVAAMQEAGCLRPVAAVADALAESDLLPKGQTSTSHVMSRLKALGASRPLEGPVASAWLQSYYSVVHIKEHGKSPGELERPDRFVFMKCDC